MTNTEKALSYMGQLNLLDEVAESFAQGKILQSTLGGGILLPVSEAQQKKISEIEKKFSDVKVWHVISDRCMINDENWQMDSYLLAWEQDETQLHNSDGKFIVSVYVDNLTWPIYSEFGEMLISERNGGIARLS